MRPYLMDRITLHGLNFYILFRPKDARVTKINDVWEITKNTISICANLGINIDAPEVVKVTIPWISRGIHTSVLSFPFLYIMTK